MSATLSIAATTQQPVMSVPLSALYNQGSGAALWKVDGDGVCELAPVTLVRYEADVALVSGELTQGTRSSCSASTSSKPVARCA